jgi:hypothetical protein
MLLFFEKATESMSGQELLFGQTFVTFWQPESAGRSTSAPALPPACGVLLAFPLAENAIRGNGEIA